MFFRWHRVLVICLIVALCVISVSEPMMLILPAALSVWLFQKQLKSVLDRWGRGIAFGIAGVSFGLFTEVAAIVTNLDKPLGERILLNPFPAVDLVLAFFWYGFFVLIWYFLLRKFQYRYGEIFLLAGAYGLIFEQKGVFLPMLLTTGFIVPIFIMAVYALFPMVAYMLTHHRFPERPARSFAVRYFVAIAALALHVVLWKLAGMAYYPILQHWGFLV